MKKITQGIFLSLFLAASFCFTPGVVSAHGEASMTFTSTTTEGHIVDVDYGDAYIEAGRMGVFIMDLFTDEARNKSVNFSDIWVRITLKNENNSGETLFAGPIAKQEFGGNRFAYVFPEGGAYTLSVRFNDASKNELMATNAGEAEFELNVLRSPDEEQFTFGVEFWVGLLGGTFALVVVGLPLMLKRRDEI
jgi:hypothetical protein